MTHANTPPHPCNFCHNLESYVQFTTVDIYADSYEIRLCQKCRAYFLTPMPTPAQLDRAYAVHYYGTGSKKFVGNTQKVIEALRAFKAKRITKWLVPHAKVLDLGCGRGDFLSSLHKMGDYALYGLELEGEVAQVASRLPFIHLTTGTLTPDSYAPNMFDAVTLFHVFEHLVNPQDTLQVLSDIIKPNGILVMSFPNIGSWQATIFQGDWLHLDPPRHLFFFKRKDLIAVMANFGFELVQENHFSLEQNPFGAVQSILNKLGFKKEALYESFKNTNDYLKGYPTYKIWIQRVLAFALAPICVLIETLSAYFKVSATSEYIFRLR